MENQSNIITTPIKWEETTGTMSSRLLHLHHMLKFEARGKHENPAVTMMFRVRVYHLVSLIPSKVCIAGWKDGHN